MMTNILTYYLVPLLLLSGANAGDTEERIFEIIKPSDDASLRVNHSDFQPENGIEYEYFERQYASTGWFSSPPILNTHVEQSVLPSLLSKRKWTHIPLSISVYAVNYPRTLVYYNIMWAVNSAKLAWKMSYGEDGMKFQATLDSYINSGYQAYQIESHAFDYAGSISYSAVFFARSYWPDDTRFEIAFGVPKDDSYCCSPRSRWMRLSNAGYKPLSVSVTQSPGSSQLYIADVWNTYDVGGWQGGMDKSAVQLQQTLASLSNLAPVYLKGYRVRDSSGRSKILFAYLAKSKDSPGLTVTTDCSNTAFAALAKLIKKPPVAFTAYSFDGEEDAEQAGYGGMYTALWEGVSVNN